MSSQASLVQAILNPLAAGGSWAKQAPVGVTRPYIVWHRYGGEAEVFYGRALPSKENGWYQVEVWAETLLAAESIIKAVEAAIVGATTIDAVPLSAPADHAQEDMELYGFRQDFSVWSDR